MVDFSFFTVDNIVESACLQGNISKDTRSEAFRWSAQTKPGFQPNIKETNRSWVLSRSSCRISCFLNFYEFLNHLILIFLRKDYSKCQIQIYHWWILVTHQTGNLRISFLVDFSKILRFELNMSLTTDPDLMRALNWKCFLFASSLKVVYKVIYVDRAFQTF